MATASTTRKFRHQWKDAIRGSNGPPHPISRAIAQALGEHMNAQGGSCFPSQETIAAETAYSLATVKRHIKLLDQQGWIITRLRGLSGQRNRRLEYRARIPFWVVADSVTETPPSERKIVSDSAEDSVTQPPNIVSEGATSISGVSQEGPSENRLQNGILTAESSAILVEALLERQTYPRFIEGDDLCTVADELGISTTGKSTRQLQGEVEAVVIRLRKTRKSSQQ